MSAVVAVYGATGYTGRVVTEALLDAGLDVVIAGRSADRLQARAAELGGRVTTHVSDRDDAATLDALCRKASLVVNIAVSYEHPGDPLAQAAIRCGVHYLDISNSAVTTGRFVETYDAPARAAGIAFASPIGCIPSISEAAASLAAEGIDETALDVEVAYAIDGWSPTGMNHDNWLYGLQGDVCEYREGVRTLDRIPPTRIVDFGPNAGPRRVFAFPGPEVHTLPGRLDARTLRVAMTTSTIAPPALGRFLPTTSRLLAWGLRHRPTAGLTRHVFDRVTGGAAERKMTDTTSFTFAVTIGGHHRRRRAFVSGRHIYGITAPIVAQVARIILAPGFTGRGVLTTLDLVDPRQLLDDLTQHRLTWSVEGASVLEGIGA